MSKLYIIIPAYNEEENIEQVAKSWHEVLLNTGDEDSRLVIIDDGSRDKTYEKLRVLQACLPKLTALTKKNSGHGATVLYGYNYALENDADYIFQTDSDGQTEPAEFYNFWEKRERYSAIIGYRNTREDGISRVFVTKVLKLVLFFYFGEWITDANTPFRLIKKDVLKKHIENIPKDFNLSNVMLTVSMIKNKEIVRFFPITFKPRQGGKNSINFRRIVGIGIQAMRDFSKIRKTLKG